jgi:hypothetical protein
VKDTVLIAVHGFIRRIVLVLVPYQFLDLLTFTLHPPRSYPGGKGTRGVSGEIPWEEVLRVSASE